MSSLKFKLVIIGLLYPASILAQDSLAFVGKVVKSTIHFPGYLEKKLIGTDSTLLNWKGFPVRLYEYSVTDSKTGIRKSAKVYTLDPTYDMLTLWVISACRSAKGRVNKKDVVKLVNWINDQSGAQFPVMGIVYEDIFTPGINTPFVFKDGVTVFPKQMVFVNSIPNAAQKEKCLHLTDSDLRSIGKYGRIASTTREQYKQAGGKDPVGNSSTNKSVVWLSTVRRLYKEALKSDNNELITAWAKSNL
jgi:hypothetical protein